MEISVIVPVCNVEPYLERCMESLLAQTFQDREIILVDDGSTDRSGLLCDSYASLPAVQVIHQENRGLGMARNRGMEAATGRFLLFLDADDYVGSGLLENLYCAVTDCNGDLSIGGFTMSGPDGRMQSRPLTQKPLVFSGEELQTVGLNMVSALPEEPLDCKYGMSACARLYRRDIIQEHQIRFVSERELISEDLIFNLDFLRFAGRVVITGDVSYVYCTNAGSLSKKHRKDRFEKDCALYQAVETKLKLLQYEETVYGLYLQRLLISRARFDLIQEVVYHDCVDRDYPLRQTVLGILDNVELRKTVAKYPWQRLPIMHGIFTWAMKRRLPGLLILLIRLKQGFLPGNQNMQRVKNTAYPRSQPQQYSGSTLR